MNILRIAILFAFCTLFINCSKDEHGLRQNSEQEKPNPKPVETPDPAPVETPESETEIYFEVIIGNNIETEFSDNWLIVHNEEGKIVDYKSYEKNDILHFDTLKASVPDKFSVSHLYVGTLTGRADFNIVSYTEVPKGSSWVIGLLNPMDTYTAPEVTGYFDVIISGDFVPPSMVYISNKEGNGVGNGGSYVNTNSSGDWVYSINRELFESDDYYLTLMSRFGETGYFYLPDVKNGDVYNLDFNMRSEFDSFINMELPVTSQIDIFLRGYPEAPSMSSSPGYDFYSISRLISGNGILPTFRLGYLGNIFHSYSFYLSAILDDYSYTYYYFGSELPRNLVIPERPIFNIDNPDIYNFEMSTDLDFRRKFNSWTSASDSENPDKRMTYWSVFSASSLVFRMGLLPEEIKQLYPEMDLSSLTYKSSKLYVDSITYDEFLGDSFSGDNYRHSLRIYEYFSL